MISPHQFPAHIRMGVLQAIGKASEMMGTGPEAFKVESVHEREGGHLVTLQQHLPSDSPYAERMHRFRIQEGEGGSPEVRHTLQYERMRGGSTSSFNPEARQARGFNDRYVEGKGWTDGRSS